MSNPGHHVRENRVEGAAVTESRRQFDPVVRSDRSSVAAGSTGGREDIHSTTYRYVDGATLEGSRRYELTFNPGELSEAGHFWSLTMYGLDCDLAQTRIDRYSIGDRTPWLRTDPDGGMTLVLQHERPDDEAVLNWLPAPEGGFCLVFRTDGPVRPVMDHAWAPPAVRVVA
jgi:hypothetical protein